MKSRGNASLPTDMVKVLKSQDGNYIRAVRQSGLKVSFCDGPISPNETNHLIQKIDKLKAQLSALADLMTPGKVGADDGSNGEDALDHEELEVLRAAGVLPPTKSKGKGRRKSTNSSKHVVFVSNDEEGQ